ncbi:hypothetical protein MalM25_09860 [Planctomycetes bacterium MalM25]|nr:hypothetical protein MalM25_09860 [Planctomycetes bacterium MalM25]
MKTQHTAWLIACGMALSLIAPASAATINWGDLTSADSNVVFEDVTENNGEAGPLFASQVPGPIVVSDMLLLDPQNFQSQSSGGGADLIDSTLSTLITAKQGGSINTIEINEFGDYSLGGLTDGEAIASVGAAFFWRVLEVDGAPVGLPNETASMTVSGGGMYQRSADDGTAVPWSGSVLIDIDAYLAGEGIDGQATAVSLRFDNTLQTAADEVSNAFIKKKGVDITVTTDRPEIPEPTTVGLMLLGFATVAASRRQG